MSRCLIPTVPNDEVGDNRWISLHLQHVSEAKEKEPEVLFIGDGIIQHLHERPIWNELFEPLHCLTFGILKDATQNVIWRVQNGILQHVKPKIIVLHVGSDNDGDPAADVADGIVEILNIIRTKLPETTVIILELLPRGKRPNPIRDRNKEVNTILEDRLHGIPNVELIPPDSSIVQPDGTISHHDMYDYAIPSNSCYRKIFEPIYEIILEITTQGRGDV